MAKGDPGATRMTVPRSSNFVTYLLAQLLTVITAFLATSQSAIATEPTALAHASTYAYDGPSPDVELVSDLGERGPASARLGMGFTLTAAPIDPSTHAYDPPAHSAWTTAAVEESASADRSQSEHSSSALGALRARRGVAIAPNNPVIVDTNAVFNRPGVTAALNPGEMPAITQTTRAELRNIVARGRVKMPGFAGELPVVDDVMNVGLRIDIRGAQAAVRPNQAGLFGDGSIGATAVRTGYPVITADRNFAAILQQFGVDVRLLG